MTKKKKTYYEDQIDMIKPGCLWENVGGELKIILEIGTSHINNAAGFKWEYCRVYSFDKDDVYDIPMEQFIESIIMHRWKMLSL